MRSPLSRRTFLGLTLGAFGCSGDVRRVSTPEGPAAEPPKPKDAAQIAQAMVGGKVSGLFFVDRVRTHAVGRKLLTLGPARELLEGTSVDPLQDLERVFVTGPSAHDARVVFFGEHTIAPQRLPQVIQDLVMKSDPPGQLLPDQPFAAVRVQKKRFSGVVAFLEPRFVVAVPEDLVGAIGSFSRTGGLPDPTGPEAAQLVALDPSRTLRARGAPRVPETISTGNATVVLNRNGGLTVNAVGQSTGPEQAPRDARELTEAIDDATSVKLGIVKIRAFRPVVFAPQGDKIVSKVDLSQAEVEQLLGLASAFLSR
jgi:hypothetical protein